MKSTRGNPINGLTCLIDLLYPLAPTGKLLSMKSTSEQKLARALPGHLDHSKLMKLLGYNLAQASIPTSKLFDKHIGDAFQLKRVEFSILMLLASNSDVTAKQLSLAINFAAPHLTVILDKLEARKLIGRTRGEADRRVLYISLTEEGERLVRQIDAVADTMEQEAVRHLTNAERGILLELLKKVAVHRKV